MHALKTFFGFDKFKGLQEQVIESVLEKKNTFAIMPTGGGKVSLLPITSAYARRNCYSGIAVNSINEKSSRCYQRYIKIKELHMY